MAEQGWQVTGLDISPSAVARASAEALARGVDASFIATDLSTWTTDDRFDLVSAAFFHSFVELPRTEILRRAADRVAPGWHARARGGEGKSVTDRVELGGTMTLQKQTNSLSTNDI